MTDTQTIGVFLDSPDWTASEKWVIKWQYRLLGDFGTALANAIKQADEHNQLRLWKGFPVEVDGFRLWCYGDLGTRLRKAGLEI
ncbi:MAG: hypothetical protein M3O20_02000 [Acidobacteriota bacterium]|nr:hypothetical protein [Acidobacteriota bacterium]